MPPLRSLIVCFVAGFAASSPGLAAEVVTILQGLDNPWGVAVQPGTDRVFVSESGAGRVVCAEEGQVREVIVGFRVGQADQRPPGPLGPAGLAFFNQSTLAVGEGGAAPGSDLLRVFELPPVAEQPLDEEKARFAVTLERTENAASGGDFLSVVTSRNVVYASSRGASANHWIARGRLRNGNLAELEPVIAWSATFDVALPAGITISPRDEVVAGFAGELSDTPDSTLAFYHATNGRKLLQLPLDLLDVSALAYGPDDQLFATDLAWQTADAGGLYQIISQLVNGRQIVRVEPVVALKRPTAMAFAADGSLYVTVLGDADEEGNSGRLLKIAM
jgi:hypothetical protein